MVNEQVVSDPEKIHRMDKAHAKIAERLRRTWPEWKPGEDQQPDFDEMAHLVLDALGETAAEILADGTLMRSLEVKNGVATLDLEPATDMLKIFTATMRGVLDGYKAENYVETQMTALPSVSLDVADEGGSYTVTVQRRTRPTPHELRMKAEHDREEILRIISGCHGNARKGICLSISDVVGELRHHGYQIPGDDDE